MPVKITTPGLVWRQRDDRTFAYWVCRSDLSKKGYPIKTQRLWSGAAGARPTPDEMQHLRIECHRLQGEMKEWGRNPELRKSKRWRHLGAIYFVRCGNRVKIGFASHIHRRICQLRVASAEPLDLIGTIPGNRYIEEFLHWQFRDARESGEWFRLDDPSLADFIAKNVKRTTFERDAA